MAKETVFQQQVRENRAHAKAQAGRDAAAAAQSAVQHQQQMNALHAQMEQQQAHFDAEQAEKRRKENAAEMLFEAKRFVKQLASDAADAPIVAMVMLELEKRHWENIGLNSSNMPDIASKTGLSDLMDDLDEVAKGLDTTPAMEQQAASVRQAFEQKISLLSALNNDPQGSLEKCVSSLEKAQRNLLEAQAAFAKWEERDPRQITEAGKKVLMIVLLFVMMFIPLAFYFEAKGGVEEAEKKVGKKSNKLTSTTAAFEAYQAFLEAADGEAILTQVFSGKDKLFDVCCGRYSSLVPAASFAGSAPMIEADDDDDAGGGVLGGIQGKILEQQRKMQDQLSAQQDQFKALTGRGKKDD